MPLIITAHLQSCHPHYLVAVIEEVWQDIKNRCFRQDEFLEGKKDKLNNYIWKRTVSMGILSIWGIQWSLRIYECPVWTYFLYASASSAIKWGKQLRPIHRGLLWALEELIYVKLLELYIKQYKCLWLLPFWHISILNFLDIASILHYGKP